MSKANQGDVLLTLSLSVWAYIDETPLPGESIAEQEARMLRDINAAMAASSAYSTWSVAWGPKLNADRSNMMYIAKNSALNQSVVAIRGTDWSFALDWLEDLAAVLSLVPYPYLSESDVKVALGTSIGVEALVALDPASYLGGVADGATIFVTGHSLGGCLASALAPYLIQQLNGSGSLVVYTFAAPSAGNGAFALAYDALFGSAGATPSAFRFYNTLDVVPNGWASLSTIETYYPSFPPCPQDFIDIINHARQWMGVEGIQYVQVGSTGDGTAIALPGHLIFLAGSTAPAIDPIGDLLFLLEAAQQHAGSTYQALLQGAPVSAELAKLRGSSRRSDRVQRRKDGGRPPHQQSPETG